MARRVGSVEAKGLDISQVPQLARYHRNGRSPVPGEAADGLAAEMSDEVPAADAGELQLKRARQECASCEVEDKLSILSLMQSA